MKKLLYISYEVKNFRQNSGAYIHTKVGIRELQKYFDLITFPFIKDDILLEKSDDLNSNELLISKPKPKRNFITWVKGSLKDSLNILLGFYRVFNLVAEIKSKNIDFIYERSSYLSLSGLLAAKYCKISIFYEINGLLDQDAKGYYPSIFNGIIGKWFEELKYSNSTWNFAVGGLIEKLQPAIQLKTQKVQNGIDSLSKNELVYKRDDGFVHIAFVAHVMAHHRIDELLNMLHQKQQSLPHIKFHFWGSGYSESHLQLLEDTSNCEYHGFLKSNENPVFLSMNMGIVPFARPYDSHMKVFKYAINSMAVILPDSYNFKSVFSNEEAYFFENENINSLLNLLIELRNNHQEIESKGKQINNLVKENYTWQKVFELTASVIKKKDSF